MRISVYRVGNSRSNQGSWDFGSKATVGILRLLVFGGKEASGYLNISPSFDKMMRSSAVIRSAIASVECGGPAYLTHLRHCYMPFGIHWQQPTSALR